MRKTHKKLLLASSIALIGYSGSALSDQITLRIGSGHPIGLLAYTDTASTFFAPELKKRIEERTEHTVRIQELHAGAIAGVTEVLDATKDGLLDIGFISLIFEPSNAFLNNFPLFLPFGTADAHMATEAGRATLEAFPELTEHFESDFNQKYLVSSCLENYGIGTNFSWTDFSDLEGRRIAGAGVNLDWIAGATPVTSNLNEAYQSIQTGVYEGYISAVPWWATFSLYEVADYFTLADFGSAYLNAVTVNLNKWNSLPEDVQEIIQEVAIEYEQVTADLCAANEEAGINKLREEGAEVVQIDPQAKVDWANAISDFPARMAEEANSRGLPGTEVLNFYMDKLEELGHEWPVRYVIE